MPVRDRVFDLLSGARPLMPFGRRRTPPLRPAGNPKSVETRMLEGGAGLLQSHMPLLGFRTYLVGFHPKKDDPEVQWEAHHYCRQVNEEFTECVLFDGNGSDANLVGIEYIISERLFNELPEQERAYWHPHNGEILSGQLIAPNLPEAAEHRLMRQKLNSYGKTWHLWDTGGDQTPGQPLPFGDPALAWSFTHAGEAHADPIARRDERMGLDTEARRRARQDLVPDAHPQEGVDALQGRYRGPTGAIAGVAEKRLSQAPDALHSNPPAPAEPDSG